ncbi:snaclec alboaggregin-A subunit beta'-like [Amphiura filiformis]|uniref:snaclec alboaggregin-A subunit beta'-like n=1 Tax=Amphiura filiformis TaxID=82378 RepID=UPI003B213375
MKTLTKLLLAFASIISFLPLLVSAINYCPPFWTHYQLQKGTYCYRYFGEKTSWLEAEATCTNFTICEGKETAHLVSIGSMEEEEFIVQYWQSMVGPFPGERGVWIGYCKEYPEEDWKWTAPTGTTHQNWYPDKGPPRDDVGCAQQISAVYGRPYWDVSECYDWHPFICKMRAM